MVYSLILSSREDYKRWVKLLSQFMIIKEIPLKYKIVKKLGEGSNAEVMLVSKVKAST